MGILCCFQSHAGGGGGHGQDVPSSSAASPSSATSWSGHKDRPLPERNNSVDYSNLVALVNEIVSDSGTKQPTHLNPSIARSPLKSVKSQ